MITKRLNYIHDYRYRYLIIGKDTSDLKWRLMFITFKSFPQLIYFLFINYKTAVLRILLRVARYVSKSIRWKREYCKRFFIILWFFWSRFDYKIHQISYIFISIIYTLISQDYNMYIFRVHRTM